MATGPTLHLVLAEAAVELVPDELGGHPSVTKAAKSRNKKPTQTLLDDTLHHAAMKKAHERGRFPDLARRGRPDILHLGLHVAMDHRLNHQGGLRVWVHTRDDHRITVDPGTRLQRSQHRFYGLLESLYQHGAVPPQSEHPLLGIAPGFTLADTIAATKAKHVFLFDEAGEDCASHDALESRFQAARDDDTCLVVGAYPTGPLESDLSGLIKDPERTIHTIALGREPLTAWTVVGEALTRWLLCGPARA